MRDPSTSQQRWGLFLPQRSYGLISVPTWDGPIAFAFMQDRTNGTWPEVPSRSDMLAGDI